MTIKICLDVSFFPLWHILITSNIAEAQCVSLVFPVEQAVYNRPQPADKSRSKEGKDTVEAYQLAQRLQSMVCFGGQGKRVGGGKFDMQVFSNQAISGNSFSCSICSFIGAPFSSSISLSRIFFFLMVSVLFSVLLHVNCPAT